MVESLVFVRDTQTRHTLVVGSTLERLRDEFLEKRVRYETNDHANGDGKEAKENGSSPHDGSLLRRRNIERLTTDKDDQDLSTTHNDANTDEEPILEEAFKDVELVVQTTVAKKKKLLVDRSQKKKGFRGTEDVLTSTG